MTLTRENYYQTVKLNGKPIVSASLLKYAYPGEGGSVAILADFLKKQDERLESGIDEEEKKHQRLGSLLHEWIKNKNQFIVSPDDRPDPWICKVIDGAAPAIKMIREQKQADGHENPVNELSSYKDYLLSSTRDQHIYDKWGDEAILRNVLKEGENYYQFILEAEGKHMISAAENKCLGGMQTAIENSPFSELLLYKKMHGGTVYSETPILWDNGDIHCKSMLDIMKIRQGDANVWIDEIKTTSGRVGTFMGRTEVAIIRGVPEHITKPGPAYLYRYYRQHSMYSFAGRKFILDNFGQEFADIARYHHGYYVVSSNEPHEVAYHVQYHPGIVIGMREIEDSLITIKEYLRTLDLGF